MEVPCVIILIAPIWLWNLSSSDVRLCDPYVRVFFKFMFDTLKKYGSLYHGGLEKNKFWPKHLPVVPFCRVAEVAELIWCALASVYMYVVSSPVLFILMDFIVFMLSAESWRGMGRGGEGDGGRLGEEGEVGGREEQGLFCVHPVCGSVGHAWCGAVWYGLAWRGVVFVYVCMPVHACARAHTPHDGLVLPPVCSDSMNFKQYLPIQAH